MVARSDQGIQRRVTVTDSRLDGIGDLAARARGLSVFDVGCNRGMAGYELAMNGARLVHGCDNYAKGIETAREVFADVYSCRSRFEVVDLTGGPKALAAAFGDDWRISTYDITLLLAVYHKLVRVMKAEALHELIGAIAKRTNKYIAWRGYFEELNELDPLFARHNFQRIQYSELSEISPAAIWARDDADH